MVPGAAAAKGIMEARVNRAEKTAVADIVSFLSLFIAVFYYSPPIENIIE
jgi:hypothetical protein